MNPLNDPVAAALAIAFGIALGWMIINLIFHSNRTFRNGVRAIKCRCGFHAPSGSFKPAIGGRDVMRCLYCDDIVYEVQRTKNNLRRTR
jgi:hypothetical protein